MSRRSRIRITKKRTKTDWTSQRMILIKKTVEMSMHGARLLSQSRWRYCFWCPHAPHQRQEKNIKFTPVNQCHVCWNSPFLHYGTVFFTSFYITSPKMSILLHPQKCSSQKKKHGRGTPTFTPWLSDPSICDQCFHHLYNTSTRCKLELTKQRGKHQGISGRRCATWKNRGYKPSRGN